MRDTEPDNIFTRDGKGNQGIRISLLAMFFVLLFNILLFVFLALPIIHTRFGIPKKLPAGIAALYQGTPTITVPPSPTEQPATATASPTNPPIPTLTSTTAIEINIDLVSGLELNNGFLVLSLRDGKNFHLFAYQPKAGDGNGGLPLTRLTSGEADDIAPAFNPEGNLLAFSSNRNGHWDLYTINVSDGEITQLTDSKAFDSNPSWSSDGQWIVFESYVDENLEIFIMPVDGTQEWIRLTDHPAGDYMPSWSPDGRTIAFVSTRSGTEQIWIANLDNPEEERFTEISNQNDQSVSKPDWSPDGRYLTWGAVTREGYHSIFRWDSMQPDTPIVEIGNGSVPSWSPDGESILAVVQTPLKTYLTAYAQNEQGVLTLSLLPLPDNVKGLDSTNHPTLPMNAVKQNAELTPEPLWQVSLQESGVEAGSRVSVVQLMNTTAPFPQLNDHVDEAFEAARVGLASAVGWDLLTELENAYIPLTSDLSPGLDGDWLYTGRAFAHNTIPINAGWMVVVREDHGPETYWRVFLKTRYQDGSQGHPLYQLPWDFNARYSGDNRSYENGGEKVSTLPAGYWVDMTDFFSAYGWERLPAISFWRSSVNAARFNEFVFIDGLDWESAMLEIYPPEVLLKPTQIPAMTPTP